MASKRSKREVALLLAIGFSAVALGALLTGVVLKYGEFQQLLLLLCAPFLVLAFLSTWALWRRDRIGAWGSFFFFAFQIVVVERDGSAFWPGYNIGFLFKLHSSVSYEVSLGVSSFVLALLAWSVVRQYWEERIIATAPRVEPLLPPNTSLERTREG